jgi:hypothetical protein
MGQNFLFICIKSAQHVMGNISMGLRTPDTHTETREFASAKGIDD